MLCFSAQELGKDELSQHASSTSHISHSSTGERKGGNIIQIRKEARKLSLFTVDITAT